jgi:hypothetical protein
MTVMLLALLASPASAPAAPAPSEKEIAALIARLDDADFQAREAAEKRLVAFGRPALPALEAAAKSGGAELSARARGIIDAVTLPADVDPERFRAAPAVLRVKLLSSGPTEKYGWDKVEVLAVLKNSPKAEFGKTMEVAHINVQAGVPDGVCTVCLEPYRVGSAGAPWKLSGGGAASGVSNVVPPAKK